VRADYFDAVIVLALVASTCCWWHIRRSADPFLVKFVLALIVALPYVGAFIYVMVQWPSRRPPAPPEGGDASAYVRRWHGREHIYLGSASAVFWGLAVLAYWMNDWRPGAIIQGRFGAYTTVDVIFFSLLVGAVLTFGLAVRAKVLLVREFKGTTFELRHQRHLETQ
jgi:hypothetical protein